MINTIIFDIGEVFLRGMIGVEYKLASILKEKPEEIFSKLQGDYLTRYFHGKLSENEYWENVLDKTGWRISPILLKAAMRQNFSEIDGTRDLINSLKDEGYKLGLLSVHGREWVEYCDKKYDYHCLFDERVYSFEAGISKPDRRAYELILGKLSSKPEESVFTDDNEKNLVEPRHMGMQAILFSSSDELRKDLERLGVSIRM